MTIWSGRIQSVDRKTDTLRVQTSAGRSISVETQQTTVVTLKDGKLGSFADLKPRHLVRVTGDLDVRTLLMPLTRRLQIEKHV